MESKIEKKSKIIIQGICIYTEYEVSDTNEGMKVLNNAKRILNGLLEKVPDKMQKLQTVSKELEKTAIENECDILFKHALALKEAATIMLSSNLPEKESLKTAIVKKLKSLNKQIDLLSKKFKRQQSVENISPNINKRKEQQNDREPSAQFSNVIPKDSHKQSNKKQQENHPEEAENNTQQNFTLNTPN